MMCEIVKKQILAIRDTGRTNMFDRQRYLQPQQPQTAGRDAVRHHGSAPRQKDPARLVNPA